MKLIPLTQGKFAKVDDEWFEYLNQWRWRFAHGYACHSFKKSNGWRVVPMQNLILPPPKGMVVDHEDNDKLNNQSYNLRYATNSQNGYNRKKDHDNTSGYKGVCKYKPSRKWKNPKDKWRAGIKINGKSVSLGTYDTPEDAAKAYDKAAINLFGEFAKTNF